MPAIVVNSLTKKFGPFAAVNDLSFSVEKNHVVGFLGPNGAGKTTTLRMLVGLSKPTSGSISISGSPVVFGSSSANTNVGYLPEAPSMYPWMSGYEYMNFVADILNVDKNAKAAKIQELLKTVDLLDAKDKLVAAYSNGMKQRLGIAQALINDPSVIIMDEPVSALDPIGRKKVLHVIEKLKKNRTVLLSTHILSDVDKICDDIVIINQGKLVVSSPLAELKEKYASPILEVEFASEPHGILQKVKNEKWVKRIEQTGTLVRIWLADSEVVNNNIPLHFFAKQGIGVLKYGLSLPETEDLFIELLGAKK